MSGPTWPPRTPVPEIEMVLADLADLDDVRRAATELAGLGPIHAIVHNAGLMPPERSESPQGHELTMAVHVLGPVLMTDLLRPVLADGARIIMVTSGGMYAQKLRADDPEYLTGDYSPTTAYARSKRAQVELLSLMGERWGDGVLRLGDPSRLGGHPGRGGVPADLPQAHPAGPARRRWRCGDDGVARGGPAATPDRDPAARPARAAHPLPCRHPAQRRRGRSHVELGDDLGRP